MKHAAASRTSALVAASFAAFLAATATAGEYRFQLVPQSSAHFESGAQAPMVGSFVGNWDATTNPGGTRTLPGVFGGNSTTNTPIPYTADLAIGASIDSIPTGGLRLTVPTNGAPGTIRGLRIDLLGGAPGDLGATIDLNFATFRTRAPDSLYIGGSFIPPIPLVVGSIDTLLLEQAADAPVVITPTATGFDFAGVVQATATMHATLQGQPIADFSQVIAVPVAGSVDTTGPFPSITLQFDASASTPLPELPAFENQAVALPTILPPGSTANLLFSGTINGPAGAFGTSIAATLIATGSPTPVDITGDGRVDGRDLGALLGAWGSANAAADLNADGIVDGADLGLLLDCWTVG
ncbi:MAG: GC-type dockerin domain-anchored protein [Phycisphaerales bacterium]